MEKRYYDLIELYLRISNPLHTSSIIKNSGCPEWIDSISDICGMREELLSIIRKLKGV